jgi:hypothetical protein
MKRFIKKIAAAGAGGLMLLSTFGGALAVGETLADLPAPFIQNDAWVSTAMVVGSAAGTNDDVARTTLKTYFDSYATATAAGLGNQIDTQEVKLQDNVATSDGLDTVYDDTDSDIFLDSTVSIGGTDYDFHTELQLDNTAGMLDVETSLTSSDDKYETDPKLEIKKDAIKYCYVFDETVNLTSVVSSSNPFDMNFLGRSYRVDTINSNTSFTVQVGDTWTGHPGETYTGNGITMEVIAIDTNSAIVDFGNDQRTINEGSTVSKGTIDIYLDTAIAGVGSAEEAVATFVIGEDARKTYNDGDAFPIYCSPSDSHGDPDCDENNPDWVWDLKGLEDSTSSSGNSICIENDFYAYNNQDDPAGVGEYYALPNGFVYLGIDSLTVADDDYMRVTITADDVSDDLSDAISGLPTDAALVQITSNVEEGLVIESSNLGNLGSNSAISSDVKTDTVYLWANDTYAGNNTLLIFYYDSDNDLQFAGNISVNNNSVQWGYINYENTKSDDMKLSFYGNGQDTNLIWVGFVPDSSLSSNDSLWFRLNTEGASSGSGIWNGFGDTEGSSENDEVVWGSTTEPNITSSTSANTFIGGKQYDLRTGYGLIVYDLDSAGDNDVFTLDIPNDQVKANIGLYEGGAAATIEPVLTTESGASGYDYLILVGGPCVNSLTAEWMGLGYPSCGEASTIAQDTAIIKLMEQDGKTALIVAGWEQADTQRAASKVAEGGLTGTEQVV